MPTIDKDQTRRIEFPPIPPPPCLPAHCDRAFLLAGQGAILK
jgi:hypothetical protein